MKLWGNDHLMVEMAKRIGGSEGLSEECLGEKFLSFHIVVLSYTFSY